MKVTNIYLATIYIIVLNLSVFGQVQIVTKAEYDEIDKFRENTHSESRIVTEIRKGLSDGKVQSTEKVEIKYESRKRNHWVVSDLVDENYKITEEIIYFDDKEYRKKGDGKWKEINRSSDGFGGFSLNGKEAEKMEQYAIANTIFKKKPARIFSHFRVYKFGGKLTFHDYIHYIDEYGKIVFEKSYISSFHPENITNTSETSYEFNPKNLRIKIPKF